MDSDSAAKISQILQLTVMKICQSVVNYTDQLAVQGVVSVEADGHDVCTVTFSDSSEKEAEKARNGAASPGPTETPRKASATLEQRRSLEQQQRQRLQLYMTDAEKDGYESDISDCDRMVIDENCSDGASDDVTARKNSGFNAGSKGTDAAKRLGACDAHSANVPSTSEASEVTTTSECNARLQLEGKFVSSAASLIPTRKVSRRKASVPIKRDDVESEDEGFESHRSRPSSQGDDDCDGDDLNEETDKATEESEEKSKPGLTAELEQLLSEDNQSDGKRLDTGGCKSREECEKSQEQEAPSKQGESDTGKAVPGGSASKFKSKLCGSAVSVSEKLSPTNELISRPPEVPESPSQKLSGGERSLVNTLVAKALKLWYDDDAPGGTLTDSPRRGYFAVSPRGKGTYELLHSPTNPRNLTRHSKETVSKALLFTADSDFNTNNPTPNGKCSSPSVVPLPGTTNSPAAATSTPSAITTARLRAMLKERVELTAASPNSVAMPIDERESASLMQFASQVPGWIPLESLTSPDITKFTSLNKKFAQMNSENAGRKPEQHGLSRKNFACHVCRKAFVHSTNLTRHLRTAHGLQSWQQQQRERATSRPDSVGAGGPGTTPRTPDILPVSLRDQRALVEKAAADAETPHRHSTSDAEAAQILSSMRELVARGMESHILAQEENEKAATPKDIQGTKVITSTATAEGSTPGAAPIALTEGPPPSVSGAAAEGPTHPPGHPNALPLSNSPRKENQFVETSGREEKPNAEPGSERNPLAPSDNGHNRLFKCLECGKRFPSHARLARHLYVCHRALIEGIAETKGQVALGTRTIPISQTTSQPISPVKMAQNGNHLCRLCGRTFTFSSNLRRHIRKMHLQSPSKVNIAFQPTININPAESDKITGSKVICDLCGQTYLTPADLDDHLRDMHQVIRKKLLFGSRGTPEAGAGHPLAAQNQNERVAEARRLLPSEPENQDVRPRKQPFKKEVNGFPLPGSLPVSSVPQSVAANMAIQSFLNSHMQAVAAQSPAVKQPTDINVQPAEQKPVQPAVVNTLPVEPVKPVQMDLSLRPLTPPLDRVRIPDKIPTSPMDLSVHVKKEPAAPKPNESSPSSQPVDLTTGPKHPVATVKEEAAVDLSFSSNAQAESGKADSNEEENSDKLEASRSLLRAALQAKQDAKSQHPKLLQLLGDNNTPLAAAANAANLSKPLENMSAGQHPDLRPAFSPLFMAQMNLFPPTNLPGGLPQFPGAPLFGSPFGFPLKRKLSGDGLPGPLSPLSTQEREKTPKPAKRRKSVASHGGYDSDGSKSPSQHSDSGASGSNSALTALDANFPSRVEGKRYICGLCSASFTFQTNLTRHQRKLHGKPFVRKPVAGSGLMSGPSPTTQIESNTTPTGSPQPPVNYEVPPTPPIFGPVLGIKAE